MTTAYVNARIKRVTNSAWRQDAADHPKLSEAGIRAAQHRAPHSGLADLADQLPSRLLRELDVGDDR